MIMTPISNCAAGIYKKIEDYAETGKNILITTSKIAVATSGGAVAGYVSAVAAVLWSYAIQVSTSDGAIVSLAGVTFSGLPPTKFQMILTNLVGRATYPAATLVGAFASIQTGLGIYEYLTNDKK